MCCTGQSANTWFHNTKTATTKNIRSHSRFSLHQPMNPTKRRQIIFCGHHVCLPSLHFPKKIQTPSQKKHNLAKFGSRTGCWRFEETCPTPWRFQSRKSSFEGCCGRGGGGGKMWWKARLSKCLIQFFVGSKWFSLVEMEHDLFRSSFYSKSRVCL